MLPQSIQTQNTDRGQVGIGTLIVFIALVLVAAIAAGVLINTAGFLQSQAEATGQESTSQVSNTVQVQSVVGQQGSASSGSVGTIVVTLAKGPGSEPIDLADAEADLITDGAAVTIDSLSGTDVTLSEITGTGSASLLANTGDRTELTLTLTGGSELTSVGALSGGADAELIITTADGSQTTVDMSVPDPFLDSPTEL